MSSIAEVLVGFELAGKLLMMSSEDRRAFEALELRIRAILPEEYQDSYEEVEPVSMGSASLKYDQDGKVAWDDIWGSFCDLAMAGGPPHKGNLLMAASREEIDAAPETYQVVLQEICRGIEMVTGLAAVPSPAPGWVRVQCTTPAMAGWLARAIVMENVAARCEGATLDLPAGPGYRVEKEIKNVITSIAKACHYWRDHTSSTQQQKIGHLFDSLAAESPLIQPATVDFHAETDRSLRRRIADSVRQTTGLTTWEAHCDGWLGFVFPTVKSAIWMMRAMVASNILARREDTILFIPVNPKTDPDGDSVVRTLRRLHRFARVRRLL